MRESLSWASLDEEQRNELCVRSELSYAVVAELVSDAHKTFQQFFDDQPHPHLKDKAVLQAVLKLEDAIDAIQALPDTKLNVLLPHLSEMLPSDPKSAKSKLRSTSWEIDSAGMRRRPRGKPRTDKMAAVAQNLLISWEDYTNRPMGRTTSLRSPYHFYGFVLPRLKIVKGVNLRGENTYRGMRQYSKLCLEAFPLARRRLGRPAAAHNRP